MNVRLSLSKAIMVLLVVRLRSISSSKPSCSNVSNTMSILLLYALDISENWRIATTEGSLFECMNTRHVNSFSMSLRSVPTEESTSIVGIRSPMRSIWAFTLAVYAAMHRIMVITLLIIHKDMKKNMKEQCISAKVKKESKIFRRFKKIYYL